MVHNCTMPMGNQKQMLNIGKAEIIIPFGRIKMTLSVFKTKEKRTETGIQDKITNMISNLIKRI